jgi:hypothetical protein
MISFRTSILVFRSLLLMVPLLQNGVLRALGMANSLLADTVLQLTNQTIFMSLTDLIIDYRSLLDSLDNIYVVDQANSKIQVFTSNGTFITKLSSKEFSKLVTRTNIF